MENKRKIRVIDIIAIILIIILLIVCYLHYVEGIPYDEILYYLSDDDTIIEDDDYEDEFYDEEYIISDLEEQTSLEGILYNKRLEKAFLATDGLAFVKRDGRWGLITVEGEELTDFKYQDINIFHNGYASVLKDGKWGFIDKNGDEISEFIYDNRAFFVTRYFAIVKVNDKFGVVDDHFNYILGLEYDDIGYFDDENLFILKKDNEYTVYSCEKDALKEEFKTNDSVLMNCSDGTILAKKDEKCGILDLQGNVLYDFEFEACLGFNNGYACVKDGDEFYFIKKDSKDKLCVLPVTNDYDEEVTYISDVQPNGLVIIAYGDNYGVVNIVSGEEIVDYKYSEISDFSEGYASVYDGEFYGFINEEGEEVLPVVYDSVTSFHDGTACIVYDNKATLINTKFENELPYYYENVAYISSLEDEIALIFTNDDDYGFIDRAGTVIAGNLNKQKIDFENATTYPNSNSIIVYKDMNDSYVYGLVDNKGNQILDYEYADLSFVNSNLLAASKDDEYYALMTTEGKELTDYVYDKFKTEKEGLICAQKDGMYGYLDTNGKEVCEFIYSGADSFSDGLATADWISEENEDDEKLGYIDRNFNFVIESKDYTYVDDFHNGKSFVTTSDGKFKIIDKSGNIITEVDCDDLRYAEYPDRYILKKDEKYGLIDSNGNVLLEPKYDSIYASYYGEYYSDEESQKYLEVKLDDKEGFIDIDGKEIVEPIYDDVGYFSEGLATVRKDDLYGFVDTDGNVKIDIKYQMAQDFREGVASVTTYMDPYYNLYSCFIDKEGKEVLDTSKYFIAFPFTNGLSQVKNTNEIGFIDHTGKVIIGNFEN